MDDPWKDDVERLREEVKGKEHLVHDSGRTKLALSDDVIDQLGLRGLAARQHTLNRLLQGQSPDVEPQEPPARW